MVHFLITFNDRIHNHIWALIYEFTHNWLESPSGQSLAGKSLWSVITFVNVLIFFAVQK